MTRLTFRVKPKSVTLIDHPIGVSKQMIRKDDAEKLSILYVGRVSARKGAYELASAFRSLATDFPTLTLVLVGACDEETRMKIYSVVGEALRPRVQFLGHRPNAEVRTLMGQCSLFIFLSTLEFFGLVVAEAMAEGACVVVARARPFDEFVENGKTGVMVDPGNLDEMKNTMTRLLLNAEERKNIGQQAHEAVYRRFRTDIIVPKNEAYYRSIMRPTASRSG